jgi:DNA polymerase elongation subunit (family B)
MTTPKSKSSPTGCGSTMGDLVKLKKKKVVIASSRKSFKMYDCVAKDKYIPPDFSDKTRPGQPGKMQFIVELYGINEVGERCAVFITDMKPYFYAKINGGNWTDTDANQFAKFLGVSINKPFSVNAKIVYHKSLFGFTNNTKQQFVRIEFNSQSIFRKVKNLWYTGNYFNRKQSMATFAANPRYVNAGLELFESDMPPLLRFFHINNLSPSGWFEIECDKSPPPEQPVTTCEYEYTTLSKYLHPLASKIANVPLLTASFDIETDSSHGDFSIPIKDYKKPTTQIVDLLQKSFVGKPLPEVRQQFSRVLKKMFSFLPSTVNNLPEIDIVYPKKMPIPLNIRTDCLLKNTNEIATNQRPYDVYEFTDVAKRWIHQIMTILESSVIDIANNVTPDALMALFTRKNFERLEAALHPDNDADEDGEEEDKKGDDGIKEDNKPKGFCEVSDTNINPGVYNVPDIMTEDGNPPTQNIFNILASTSIPRDKKIQYINYILTIVLPPLEGDKITFIGVSFIRKGEAEPFEHHEVVLNTCASVADCIIHEVATERELLLKWTEIMNQKSPDVITGYNIFGFDYPFIFHRAQENNCVDEVFRFSKKKEETGVIRKYTAGNTEPTINPDAAKPTVSELTHNITAQRSNTDLSVSLNVTSVKLAAGEFLEYTPQLSGVIQYDMLFYCRREQNYGSYRLDDVSGFNICDTITNISDDNVPGQILLHCENVVGLHTGDYICIEIVGIASSTYVNGGDILTKRDRTTNSEKIKIQVLDVINCGTRHKTVVIDAKYESLIRTQVASKTQVGKDAPKIRWCIAKDDVTPQEIFKLARGSDQDRATIAKYCRQDCNLPIFLSNKMDVLNGYTEMADICSVTINMLVLRGQGIKLQSFIGLKCFRAGILMPDLPKVKNMSYDGATVLDPKRDMYGDNPIGCNDYQSLYPSIADGWGLSPDAKVWTADFDLNGIKIAERGDRCLLDGTQIPTKILHTYNFNGNPELYAASKFKYDNLPGYRYNTTTFALKEPILGGKSKKPKYINVGYRKCRWAVPLDSKTIIPEVVHYLMGARAATRALIKTEKDEFTANILDNRQKGYKVTANSVYGQLGSAVSAFRDIDVAASITSIGRLMITFARTVIERVYANSLFTSKNHGVVRTRSSYVYGDTDSVFYTFNLEDAETGAPIRGNKALEISIEISQESAELVSKFLPPPMKLTYEKTLMNFIILSKKRYVGIKFETMGKPGQLVIMGLQIKKRDTCNCVKDIYGDIMMMFIENATNVEPISQYLNTSLQNIVGGKFDADKFIQTKSLGSNYVNPNSTAHNVLANRIGEREPGNRPKPGDRIAFIYFENNNVGTGSGARGKLLTGDKIETLDFIQKQKLSIDYTYYVTNHIQNPLLQMLGLALLSFLRHLNKPKDIQKYYKAMDSYTEEANGDLAIFNKKQEIYCSNQIRLLLFDPFLVQLANKLKHQRPITNFYTKLPSTSDKIGEYQIIKKASFRT